MIDNFKNIISSTVDGIGSTKLKVYPLMNAIKEAARDEKNYGNIKESLRYQAVYDILDRLNKLDREGAERVALFHLAKSYNPHRESFDMIDIANGWF